LGIAYFDPLTPGPSPEGRGEQKQWLARCVHTIASGRGQSEGIKYGFSLKVFDLIPLTPTLSLRERG